MPSLARRSTLSVSTSLLPKHEKSPQPISSINTSTIFGLVAAWVGTFTPEIATTVSAASKQRPEDVEASADFILPGACSDGGHGGTADIAVVPSASNELPCQMNPQCGTRSHVSCDAGSRAGKCCNGKQRCPHGFTLIDLTGYRCEAHCDCRASSRCRDRHRHPSQTIVLRGFPGLARRLPGAVPLSRLRTR